MLHPQLQELKIRLDTLLARCEEVTAALGKNPDHDERHRLATELHAIAQELDSVNTERRALGDKLNTSELQR